jgi:hypothetical protein
MGFVKGGYDFEQENKIHVSIKIDFLGSWVCNEGECVWVVEGHYGLVNEVEKLVKSVEITILGQ